MSTPDNTTQPSDNPSAETPEEALHATLSAMDATELLAMLSHITNSLERFLVDNHLNSHRVTLIARDLRNLDNSTVVSTEDFQFVQGLTELIGGRGQLVEVERPVGTDTVDVAEPAPSTDVVQPTPATSSDEPSEAQGPFECGFDQAWVGACHHPVEHEGDRCAEHREACQSCGAPATHSCEETGQFVCGAPLCDNCTHTLFPQGHNGGIGFNAIPLGEGYKRHNPRGYVFPPEAFGTAY